MEERLERNWKLIMILRGNIKDSDLATLIVFLLSFNYRQPRVFWEMKISMLRQVVDLNPFIRDVISKFCYEEKIDQSLERNIENLVKEHYSLLQRIILDWEFLELSEKEYNSAFDYIFEKINNLAGKFGAFSTSRSLRYLIQELTPKNSLTAMDPACGSGSLLADFLSNGGKRVYGQDIDSDSLNYAKLRFLGNPNVNLSLGDSLISEFFEGQKTDIVLCNPPYNLRIDREQHFHINQSFGDGMIRPGSINLAWVKLGLHNLKEDGIGIFILPLSSLSHSLDEEVRRYLVESGQIQAIICLPANMLLYSSIPVCIWVVQKKSFSTHTNVLLIDASGAGSSMGRNIASLDDSIVSDLGLLVNTFRKGGVLKKSNQYDYVVVSKDQIKKQEYYLQPNRFFEWPKLIDSNPLEYEELGKVLSRPNIKTVDEPLREIKKLSVQNLEGSLSRSSINIDDLKYGGKKATYILSNKPVLLLARIGKKLKPTILTNYQSVAFDFVNIFVYEIDLKKAFLEYLIIELEQPYVLEQIDRLQSGATIPFLNRKDIERLMIKLPSLADQKKAVDKEKQMLVRVAERELKSLTEKIGLERADANSFLRHKIAGPLRNLRGAFNNINLLLEEHVISQFPELLDKKINDKRTKTFKDYLQIFERDLEKVTKLINQSSDEYAIENKSLEEVELITFIQNYVGDIEGAEKGVSFKLFIERNSLDEAEATEIVILSNSELLRDLLDNLVRNAIMHGFKDFDGKKEIRFKIVPVLIERSLKVHLNVSNSGIPVGSSFTFDLFSKMGAKTGPSEGDGFGLWYVKEIMKKHNGEVKFTDESRQASEIENTMVSTFELIFPVKDLKKNNGEI